MPVSGRGSGARVSQRMAVTVRMVSVPVGKLVSASPSRRHVGRKCIFIYEYAALGLLQVTKLARYVKFYLNLYAVNVELC